MMKLCKLENCSRRGTLRRELPNAGRNKRKGIPVLAVTMPLEAGPHITVGVIDSAKPSMGIREYCHPA